MARTVSETLHEVTIEYLDKLDMNNLPTAHEIEGDILDKSRVAIIAENAMREKGDKWKIPHTLTPAQIADIILRLYNVKNIACAGINSDESYDILAIYEDDGPNKGIYVTSENAIGKLVRSFYYTASTRDIAEVIAILKEQSPRVSRNEDRDLIAVNNGIFHYDTKTLTDFDPDIVFIAKSHVNYNPKAKNVTIHNKADGTDWDVESWMNDLSDDPEIVKSLWEILGAIIRPNVAWDKSAWFYSNTGNNGKGTLCELMRQLSGEGSYASIPLSDFSKDFMLEPLISSSAVIVDENDVGIFIDKCANLKAVITNDVIQLNRKFKTPIAYKFKGFMVQCLNEYPRIKDKSDSFYRRQLFIPFDKCFTGKERKYIKADYLHRPEVLEYVLHKVLHMDYYKLSEPAICKQTLEEYKSFNDPVRQFLDEMLPQVVWDLQPFDWLFELYKQWFKENSPNGGIQGKNTFINDVKNAIPNYPDWTVANNGNSVRPDKLITDPEPLIDDYNVTKWMSQGYTGGDANARCTPTLKAAYKGIVRI